jgi:enoyl-CoA hydratase/carnithine racemase
MQAADASEAIQLERRQGGRVAVVAIARPQRRNAVDLDARLRLREAFNTIAADPAVRLVVLTGRGGHFCAGDDIKSFPDPADTDAVAHWQAAIRGSYEAMAALRLPVVAAISGVCIGGGLSLAMQCDFRVADRSARFGIPAVKLSVTYPMAPVQRLVGLVGLPNARRWLLTGETVAADAAHATGLVDQVADGDGGDLVDRAIAFAAPIIDAAPLAVSALKLQLDAIADQAVAERAAAIEAAQRAVQRSEDGREAVRAFAEKRAPRFQGR